MNCDVNAVLNQGYFYHGTNAKLNVNDLLIPKRKEKLGQRPRRLIMLEDLFEEVRRNEFPQRPSRLNCVYVADKPEKALQKDYLYQVIADGNLFLTDQNLFTFAGSYAKNKNELIDYARSYWSEIKRSYDRPEILVEGEVKIIKIF